MTLAFTLMELLEIEAQRRLRDGDRLRVPASNAALNERQWQPLGYDPFDPPKDVSRAGLEEMKVKHVLQRAGCASVS